MAKASVRVVANRAALETAVLAVADGMLEAGELMVRAARPPDSPFQPYPTGEGLPKQGGWLGYVNGAKFGGGSLRGLQPRKPRSDVPRTGIAIVVGFGFPARFVELGTVRVRARPFLTPAVMSIVPTADVVISAAVRRRLAGIRDTTVGDRIAASRAAKQQRLNARAAADLELASPGITAALRATR